MENDSLVLWAGEQARILLATTGNRWLHVQSVVEQARSVGTIFDEGEQAVLLAAAYLHDIGYAPTLRHTNFHPLDGALYLRSLHKERLACLVAHHSEARYEARLRGYESVLDTFPYETSAIADALTYCDMTTGPLGQRFSFEERIADIFNRYGETDIVTQAIHRALPNLSLAVWRTQDLLRHFKKS